MTRFKVVSLFSGCGGADRGLLGDFSYLNKRYSGLPFEIVHASDINERAVKTYNLNFEAPAMVADVANLSFPLGFADVVIGGFPCQAFSTVNPTKQPGKESNQLFWQMAKVIESIRPSVFIAENVKGFFRLKGGLYFHLANSEFISLGYKTYPALLNSSDFGVPQLRERLFIVGIKESIPGKYEFPCAVCGSGTSKTKVPLRRVIRNLIPPHPKYYFSKKAVQGAKNAKPNMKRLLAQNIDGQCLTITSHLAKVSINSRDPVLLVSKKKELYRRFTPREAARIQSFPNDFKFFGCDGDAYRQIGNAIPPVLFWHLAHSLIPILKAAHKQKNHSLSLHNQYEVLAAA